MKCLENISKEDIKTTIKITGTYNTRHIGGYKGYNGALTDSKAYIRSDVPSRITNDDIINLVHFGVETVIDLRVEDEIEAYPVPFDEFAEISYVNIPFISMHETPPHLMMDGSLGDLYIHILKDRKKQVAEALKMIIRTEKTVFFNCSAGKDRTGILAMLLLKLAGVSREDIVKDYYYTHILLKPWIEKNVKRMNEAGIEYNVKMLDAFPEYMEQALDYLDENYESIEAYMYDIGLSKKDIELLNNKTLGI